MTDLAVARARALAAGRHLVWRLGLGVDTAPIADHVRVRGNVHVAVRVSPCLVEVRLVLGGAEPFEREEAAAQRTRERDAEEEDMLILPRALSAIDDRQCVESPSSR